MKVPLIDPTWMKVPFIEINEGVPADALGADQSARLRTGLLASCSAPAERFPPLAGSDPQCRVHQRLAGVGDHRRLHGLDEALHLRDAGGLVLPRLQQELQLVRVTG